MKKISFIVCFLIFTEFSSFGQNPYSQKSLEHASQEELDLYLNKARKTKKVGAIMSISGSVALIGGMVLVSSSNFENPENALISGIFLWGAGTISTVFGLPIFIGGASKVNRIKKIKRNSNSEVMIDIVPCGFRSYHTQNQQYGMSIRVKF